MSVFVEKFWKIIQTCFYSLNYDKENFVLAHKNLKCPPHKVVKDINEGLYS